MFRMPNRVYYAQFADMDTANLRQTIANVLLYTTVELLTLVAVHASLRRLLRFSPLRQLAFVLTRQAVHVQSALILWVVYSTQATLDHFGKWQLRIILTDVTLSAIASGQMQGVDSPRLHCDA